MRFSIRDVRGAIAPIALVTLPAIALGGDEPTFDPAWAEAFTWRSIGPANMSGRIVDIDVHPEDHSLWLISTASGGLLKTTNAGATFEYLFQDQSTVSIGATAIAASDPQIIWIGTGEQNPRNSSSWGDGVYKSTDGGDTWTHMGLKETFTTGDILIHPEDPDIVFVGAMGRTWGTNPERGLFKTTDGGETWEKILYVDDTTGVIDLTMHPDNPDIMLCAMWERLRDEFDTNDPKKRHGPGAGLYKTTDAGESWKKINQGLPSVNIGRLGMDWSLSEPDTLYMLVDTEQIGMGGTETPAFLGVSSGDADVGARVTNVVEETPAAEAGLEDDDIIIEFDGETVLSSNDLTSKIRRKAPEDEVVLAVVRDGEIMEFDVTLAEHPDPDAKPFQSDLDGQAPNVSDQQGEDGVETGGLFKSSDAGDSWTRVNSINPRPMYFSKVAIDPQDPTYQWVAGVSLMRSVDGGETYTRDGGPGVHADGHAFWIDPNDGRHILVGCDGGLYETHDRGTSWRHYNQFAIGQFYHVTTDNQPLYMVYGGLQDNGSWGAPNRTRSGSGTDNTDWFRIGGGDGFICLVDPEDPDQLYMASQNGGIRRSNLRTGDSRSLRPRPERGSDLEYRFNWKTPFALSSHNSRIYYAAGNYVFRSIAKGDNMELISPEITRTNRGTATAFSESPADSDVLYVGTDDGALWVTEDGGDEWFNIIYPREPDPIEEDEEEPETEQSDEADEAQSDEGESDEAESEEAESDEAEPEEAQSEETESDESEAPPARTERPTPRRGGRRPGGAEQGQRGQPGGQGGRAGAMFENLDQNGNGKLSKDEIPERMRGFIANADTNADGDITLAELQASFQNRAGGFAQRGGAGERGGADRRGGGDQPRRAREGGTRRPTVEQDQPEQDQPEQASDDPITGTWVLSTSNQFGESETTLDITRNEDGSLQGRLTSDFLDNKTDSLTFNEETGEITFKFTTNFGDASGSAKVDGDSITGTFNFGGQFETEFTGTREHEATDEPTGATLESLIPGPGRFSSIEASRYSAGRVYATIDRHYYDDTGAYVVMSSDFGKSWELLSNDLPDGSARVIREDLKNQNLLYLGTEFALFISIDRGATWTKFNNNLPTVAIHEIAQHPISGEIVAGTHGRSVWAADITPLRSLDDSALSAPAHLIAPAKVIRWHNVPSGGSVGGVGFFRGQNPDNNAHIYFMLNGANNVSLKILSADGTLVRQFTDLETKNGLNHVQWDMRQAPPAGAQGQGRGRGRFRRGRQVGLGTYRVVLEAGSMRMERTLVIEADPEYAN